MYFIDTVFVTEVKSACFYQKYLLLFFQVNSILRHVAELLNYETDEQLEELYVKTAWFFDRKFKKAGAAYDAFKHAVTWVFHYISLSRYTGNK